MHNDSSPEQTQAQVTSAQFYWQEQASLFVSLNKSSKTLKLLLTACLPGQTCNCGMLATMIAAQSKVQAELTFALHHCQQQPFTCDSMSKVAAKTGIKTLVETVAEVNIIQ